MKMSANALGVDEDQLPINMTTTTVPQPDQSTIDEIDCEELDPVQHYSELQSNSIVRATPSFVATNGKGSNSAGKNANERKIIGGATSDEKLRTEADAEFTELLGSVTTHNCPGTRASARVIQKMKQDQTRPTTPPPHERDGKRDDKSSQKTPSQLRSHKPSWTNLERNHFFDALNEYGKDFDALGNYINSKLKRKSTTDVAFKTKDQVRQHYYQTYHKICKYIKFSDEVKKPVQELYALINYGEMRRKLQFVTDKHFMKLRNLVYQGYITVRCKGKNIRIKTPSCKTLRRLNQLDDTLEDIRLPSKIEVIISPANMEAFGRVQTVAQNPRARTTVPLHKKLVNFIKTFQYKWRSAEMKLAEEELKLFPPANMPIVIDFIGQQTDVMSANQQERQILPAYQDPEMCFLPKPGVTIHRPLLSITEYLSSNNICLTAYEERMGVKVRGETLFQERSVGKRQRTESGSEKRSPDAKKQKQFSSPPHEKTDLEECVSDSVMVKEEAAVSIDQEHTPAKGESSSDELSDEINDLLTDMNCLVNEEPANSTDYIKTELASNISSLSAPSSISLNAVNTGSSSRVRRSAHSRSTRTTNNFKPLISEEVIRRIRRGWTASTGADITIGDLYVVLGQDSKLELEYYWTNRPQQSQQVLANSNLTAITSGSGVNDFAANDCNGVVFPQKQTGMPYNPSECDDTHLLKTLSTSNVANKLKHLLLIANLSERIRKRQCSCGHTCDRSAAKTRLERNLATKTFVSPKTFSTSNSGENGSVFRQPVVPIRRPIFNMDPVKQINTLGRQKQSRQVLVQRLLLPGAANQPYDVVNVKNFQNNLIDMPNSSSESQTSQTNTKSTVTATAAATLNCTEKSSITATTIDYKAEETNLVAASHNFHMSSNDTIVDKLPYHIPLLQVPQAAPTEINPSTSSLCESNNTSQLSGDDNGELSMAGSFPDSAFDECTSHSTFNGMTPAHLLRESTSNSRWLEENLNDFSLTSLLGHLDEINASRDILDPSSSLSVISESSVDYMHKFQEITALMQSQEKD